MRDDNLEKSSNKESRFNVSKIHLHSAIHVYHRCLTINSVCILTFINKSPVSSKVQIINFSSAVLQALDSLSASSALSGSLTY